MACADPCWSRACRSRSQVCIPFEKDQRGVTSQQRACARALNLGVLQLGGLCRYSKALLKPRHLPTIHVPPAPLAAAVPAFIRTFWPVVCFCARCCRAALSTHRCGIRGSPALSSVKSGKSKFPLIGSFAGCLGRFGLLSTTVVSTSNCRAVGAGAASPEGQIQEPATLHRCDHVENGSHPRRTYMNNLLQFQTGVTDLSTLSCSKLVQQELLEQAGAC